MLPHQTHTPGQRLGTGPRHPSVHERVEHLTFALAQTCHRRYGQMREELAGLADPGAPGNAAAVLGLGLVGDLHPLLAGVLAPSGDPALRGCSLVTLGRGQLTDHGDLVAVYGDAQVPGEPVVGDAPGEPGGRIRGVGQVLLLPTAWAPKGAAASGPASASSAARTISDVVFVLHRKPPSDYLITRLLHYIRFSRRDRGHIPCSRGSLPIPSNRPTGLT